MSIETTTRNGVPPKRALQALRCAIMADMGRLLTGGHCHGGPTLRSLAVALLLALASSSALGQAESPVTLPPNATIAQRAEFYRSIAGVSSTGTLEALAQNAAASQAGTGREQIAIIVERYYELDPAGALRLAGKLWRSGAANLPVQLYERLARDDANQALSELSLIDDPAQASMAAMAAFRGIGADGRAFELVLASLHGGAADEFRSNALARLLEDDPRRAAEIMEGLPADRVRPELVSMIAARYARQDPEAALAWARRLGVEDPGVTGMILQSLAQSDPVRAFDLAISMDEPRRTQGLFGAINAAIADRETFTALATRTLAIEDDQSRNALLLGLIGSWTRDPNNVGAALEWMLSSTAALPPEAFERLAFVYAQSDPNAAVTYVDRVPSSARAAWLSAVAVAYAAADPRGATALIERFRGDPAYDRAALAVAQQWAATDPPAAARLLASVDARGAPAGPEAAIARAWAERDAAAAAQWALELPGLSRNIALAVVTGTWAAREPEAVRDWALRLPPGEKRDAVLVGVVRSRGAAPPDEGLLAAFSDEGARQSAVMGMVVATAQTDPDRARALLDAYVTDPRMRAQAEQIVAGFARGGVPTPAGLPMLGGASAGVPMPATGATQVVIGAMPAGAVGGNLMIGPNGDPVLMRSTQPGLVPLPPGTRTGPPPLPAPPAPRRDRSAGQDEAEPR